MIFLPLILIALVTFTAVYVINFLFHQEIVKTSATVARVIPIIAPIPRTIFLEDTGCPRILNTSGLNHGYRVFKFPFKSKYCNCIFLVLLSSKIS